MKSDELQKQAPEKANLAKHHEAFIQDQNHCALCRTELEIQSKSFCKENSVLEEAYCPSCDLITRTKNHNMH